jgi:hypothetical protein
MTPKPSSPFRGNKIRSRTGHGLVTRMVTRMVTKMVTQMVTWATSQLLQMSHLTRVTLSKFCVYLNLVFPDP